MTDGAENIPPAAARYGFRTAPWGDRIQYLAADTSLDPSFHESGLSWAWELAALRDMVPVNGTVLDVGANMGYLTCYFSHLVGSAGRVHAFEPGTEIASVLRANVLANGYRNVYINEVAIDCENNAEAELWLDASKYGRQSLCRANTPNPVCAQRISALTLDNYFCQQITEDTIDLLKVDVEGAEPRVLFGGERTLRHTRNLWFEFWPDGIENFGMEAYGVIDWLLGTDFQLVQWDLPTGWHQVVTSPDEVACVIDRMRMRSDARHLLPIVYIHGRARGIA